MLLLLQPSGTFERSPLSTDKKHMSNFTDSLGFFFFLPVCIKCSKHLADLLPKSGSYLQPID